MKIRNCTSFALALLALAVAAATTGAQSTYTPYTFTTLAGGGGFTNAYGTGDAERLWAPSGVAVDANGNVYLGDQFNNVVRKVMPVGTNWVVTTLAGLAGSSDSVDGTGSAARFDDPWGMAVDSAGNVYVADPGTSTIRKVTPVGTVTTLAGLEYTPGNVDGTGNEAQFNFGYGGSGMALNSEGNIYVADQNNDTIRKVTPAGVVTTLATGFNSPVGVAVDTNDNVYVADQGTDRIRKV